MTFEPVTPRLERLCRATVAIAAPLVVGDTPLGLRRIIPITGGRVEGARFSGEELPGGADWQIVRADGGAVLEARYTVRTPDGALVYVRNIGLRCGPPEVLARLGRGQPVDPALLLLPHHAPLRDRRAGPCVAQRRDRGGLGGAAGRRGDPRLLRGRLAGRTTYRAATGSPAPRGPPSRSGW